MSLLLVKMVKIKNENFNKLSQLDRIEYTQREGECKIDFDISSIFWNIIILISIFMVSGYIELAKTFIPIVVIVFVVNIIGIIVCSIIEKQRYQKLATEYFDIVVKKKDNK